MDGFFHELFLAITAGSHAGMIAILILLIIGIAFLALKRETSHYTERKELIAGFQKQIEDERDDLMKILEKYQDGQMSMVQAMNEIKVLIATIGAKL